MSKVTVIKKYLVLSAHLVATLVLLWQITPTTVVLALTPEQRRLLNISPWFDTTVVTACNASFTPAGSLPSIIPEPYNGAFTAGAGKHNVAPALIAALFTEENFTGTDPAKLPDRWTSFLKQRSDPNSGWPTNQFHTMGAFQFLPTTWYGKAAQDPAASFDANQPNQYGYGDDGDNDQKRDPQHIADAAAGAANYVAHNGATKDKTPDQWRNAIFAYNHANWYVDAVLKYYGYYNSLASASGASTGDQGGVVNVSNTTSTGCGATASCPTVTGGVATGNVALVCEARKFDPFGYLWGGGHEDPEKFMNRFNSAGGYTQTPVRIVDCSGLETVAIWNAYHVKMLLNTSNFGSFPQYLQRIGSNDIQVGDLLVRTGEHTEIATSAGGNSTFGAHDVYPDINKDISEVQVKQSWDSAYRYIGPGSSSGGGTQL